MSSEPHSQSPRIALWKWATVLILIYVFLAGWLVPLNPGIIEVTPERANAGDTITLSVKGYNSRYDQGQPPTAWLRLAGDTMIKSLDIDVKDERNLAATFYIPSAFPTEKQAYPLVLVLDHETDGYSVLPNAIFVSPAAAPDASEEALWHKAKMSEAHAKKGIQFPYRNILAETIRNTYFHVPMWFGMILLFAFSAWYSLRYYRKGDFEDDLRSVAFVRVGLIFGMLGIVTGMLWAKNTWNAYWSWDVKQNMSAVCLLIYAGLMVMRSSVEDEMQRARLSAGYNMFAFLLVIPLLFIIPRMTDSLHPGSGGNPALGGEDLDNTMRLVFYPAVIGFMLLGIWMSRLSYRISRLNRTTAS